MHQVLILTAIISTGILLAILIPYFLHGKLKTSLASITKEEEPDHPTPVIPITAYQSLKDTLRNPPPIFDEPIDDEEWTLEWDGENEAEAYEWMPLAESALLKQAEDIVDDIQGVIDNLESTPPNKEELLTKIAAVLSNLSIFKKTEYYDPINNYIAVAVERDTDIQLTNEEITKLWA